jgi:hypothetical protein
MATSSNPDEIMNSLDGIRRAEPLPFFTGRLLARLNAANEPAIPPFWHRWGWTLSFAFLLILIGINILLITRHADTEKGMLTEYEDTTPQWVQQYTTQPSASVYQSPNP